VLMGKVGPSSWAMSGENVVYDTLGPHHMRNSTHPHYENRSISEARPPHPPPPPPTQVVVSTAGAGQTDIRSADLTSNVTITAQGQPITRPRDSVDQRPNAQRSEDDGRMDSPGALWDIEVDDGACIDWEFFSESGF
jgi:hypothetical protein